MTTTAMRATLPLIAIARVLPASAATQSPLVPHSAEAAQTATLAWTLFGAGTLIFVLVMIVAAVAVRGRLRRPAWMTDRVLLVGGGIAFPAVVLAMLLAYTMVVASRLGQASATPPLRLEVTGEMWWWRVHYVDADGRPLLATANEVHVPVGRPVEIALRTADVIHSFWVPGLSGMLDMIPGRVNVLRFTADHAGVLRGQCAEFCGAQHARMGFDVRVHDAGDFDRWLVQQREPARGPDSDTLAQGQRLFVAHCGRCHAVRGTTALGTAGPDLTHVGSRASIAAGTLPNNAGTIAAWIVSGQHLKPGNRMPDFPDFTGSELTSLAHYVASLR